MEAGLGKKNLIKSIDESDREIISLSPSENHREQDWDPPGTAAAASGRGTAERMRVPGTVARICWGWRGRTSSR